MDYNARREGKKRVQPNFPAVIVGEFTSNHCTLTNSGKYMYPLSPVVPSSSLPTALLPICNTPLIAYTLENLIQNGVDEVFILVQVDSYTQVKKYLDETRTSRGKPWTQSNDMKVQIIQSTRNLVSLFDVASEILDRNLIKQDESFLLVPIEAVAVFSDLRDLYNLHLQRTEDVSRYAATVLCSSVMHTLRDTLHNVVVTEAISHADNRAEEAQDPMSPTFATGPAVPDFRSHMVAVPSKPQNNAHTLLMLNKDTGVVRYIARFDSKDKEVPVLPVAEFSKKHRVSVRADLVPSGFMFISSGALSLFKFYIHEQHDFFSDLLTKEELEGNVFGIAEVSPETVINAINSLPAYLQTNVDVCSRRFFPLTRECCFAEAHAKYSISPLSQSVYVHRDAVRIQTSKCGPNVVLGKGVALLPQSVVKCTVFSPHVSVGDRVDISGSVIMEGSTIGNGCKIINSVIGSGVTIQDGAEITNCVIGNGCKIGRMNVVGADGRTTETGVQIQEQAIEVCSVEKSDTWLVGEGGLGRVLSDRFVYSAIATQDLLTEDAVPRESGDHEDETESDESEEGGLKIFQLNVRHLVDRTLAQPASQPITSTVMELKNIRTSFFCSNADLCGIVTRVILEHVGRTHVSSSPEMAMDAAVDLVSQWCQPFFSELVRGMDEMIAILRGICAAVNKPESPLREQGPLLLECFYNGCDEDMYNEQGYCIISGDALLHFDDLVQKTVVSKSAPSMFFDESSEEEEDDNNNNNNSHNDDDSSDSDDSDDKDDDDDDDGMDSEEEGVRVIGTQCHAYISGVRAFLEDDDGDDDDGAGIDDDDDDDYM